ncbi:hypothetical protein O59_002875 [Cellvibrio sp. BR]|uniref:winged helix-turn-helix domain-containing protein n=1 Tax=Cellvibrio sp. BR TaxID=1134474 RepID=UPI0002600E38|nr:winged helix-turn-helix domain-containing protein [Cellvibrio sp. BR]EIK44545.1 hypothetical protein O59_002875 [Cellvibrio sp. BR]
MRWKIAQFVFCEKSQTLNDKGTTIILEPLSVEVLAYFCRNPNVMISRDVLIAEVWNGRIVTDNAVTRVITKLRKALADKLESPQFIATFPKKGYKFVAEVTPLDEYSEALPLSSPNNLSSNRMHTEKWVQYLVVFMLAVCGLLVWLWVSSAPQPVSSGISYRIGALTRGVDREFHPAASPNGRYLAYSAFNADQIRLLLKDIESQETLEIGDQHGWSGPAAWSSDGTQLVYLNTTRDACKYYLLTLANLVVTERKLIHNCPKGSHGKIIFGRKPHTFIYAEAGSAGSPFSIFEINVSTGDVRRLPQPELVLGGNSQFDLHPTENKLLISSPNRQQWLNIYSLDLTNDELRHLFELREYTCCAIWDHTGMRVVIQGEHPAKELISFNLDGKDRAVLFQVPHSVSSPSRIPNSAHYAYVGGEVNRDIYVHSFATQTSKVIIDSAIDDWLPVISQDGKNLAFMSDRSGNEEIWIRERGQTFERKLTSYNDGRHYFDLQWSPDGKLIAGMTINEIHLTDAVNGNWRKLKIPHEELVAISWKDNQTLSFSIKKSGQWILHHYRIDNDQLTAASGDWQFARYAISSNDSLWIDHNDNAFYGESRTHLELAELRILQNKRLNLVKKGDSVFYTALDSSGSQLMQADVKAKHIVPLFKVDNPSGLSINESEIYYSLRVNGDTNIYRTERSNRGNIKSD